MLEGRLQRNPYWSYEIGRFIHISRAPSAMVTRTKSTLGSIYHQHREQQRRRILDAARELFDKRGIDRTTMAEVMAGSGLRASTLSEYFSNKGDIVWAIFTQIVEEGSTRAKIAVEGATTGLAKIVALLGHMADELSNDLAKIRFMAQFDAMYARDWPVERLLTLEGHFSDSGFVAFTELIKEGIALECLSLAKTRVRYKRPEGYRPSPVGLEGGPRQLYNRYKNRDSGKTKGQPFWVDLYINH
jgi:AcrR family transcriptional regulator